MRVLVTGAAGRVGTVVCQEIARVHSLRLLDIRPCALPPAGVEALQGSVADMGTVQRAVDGMEGVVHLAIHNPSEQQSQAYAEYMQSDVDIGVKGTDLLLWAAKEAGVQRFVYVSSLNVYSARYPGPGEFLTDRDEPLSAEHYGTIKWLAEELCRHYAQGQGMPVTVLRLNSVTFPDTWAAQGRDVEHPGYACTRVHVLDVAHAIRLALEKESIGWGRCLVSGTNPEKRFDTQTADDLIGFRARYGFEAGRMYRDGVLVDSR